jgi:hypothetical protein
MTQRIQRRAGGILALTIALGAIAAPASPARTFDFNARGSMTQRPLPRASACAMRRAQADRTIPCRATHADDDVATQPSPAPGRRDLL